MTSAGKPLVCPGRVELSQGISHHLASLALYSSGSRLGLMLCVPEEQTFSGDRTCICSLDLLRTFFPEELYPLHNPSPIQSQEGEQVNRSVVSGHNLERKGKVLFVCLLFLFFVVVCLLALLPFLKSWPLSLFG